jgi:uncharacterized protein YqiB (DUF1249 family)
MSDLLVQSTDRGLWLWLMELYENNYELLAVLCGPLRDLPEAWSSCRNDEVWLTLKAQILGPYTTALEYSVSLQGMGLLAQARLYHDARICEVISCRLGTNEDGRTGRSADPSVATEVQNLPIQEKWTLNLRFHHWLEYALAGRYFASRALCPGRAPHAALMHHCTKANSS